MSFIKRGRKDVVTLPVDNVHDGSGTINIRQLLGCEPKLPMLPGFPEDFDTAMSFFMELDLPAGAVIGRHLHEGNEEIYYVLSGKGEMTVDSSTMVMEAGDACLTKSGSEHTFKNIGDGELRILVVEATLDARKL